MKQFARQHHRARRGEGPRQRQFVGSRGVRHRDEDGSAALRVASPLKNTKVTQINWTRRSRRRPGGPPACPTGNCGSVLFVPDREGRPGEPQSWSSAMTVRAGCLRGTAGATCETTGRSIRETESSPTKLISRLPKLGRWSRQVLSCPSTSGRNANDVMTYTLNGAASLVEEASVLAAEGFSFREILEQNIRFKPGTELID